VYDRVSHLKIAHDVWLNLCNTYEGSSEIKSTHKYTYNRQYKLSLKNQVNPWMIVLLILSPLSVAYVLVVHLLILTMNVLNNFSMRLLILYGA
jgi:hypothetical protein